MMLYPRWFVTPDAIHVVLPEAARRKVAPRHLDKFGVKLTKLTRLSDAGDLIWLSAEGWIIIGIEAAFLLPARLISSTS
jgi:hypothetical protein